MASNLAAKFKAQFWAKVSDLSLITRALIANLGTFLKPEDIAYNVVEWALMLNEIALQAGWCTYEVHWFIHFDFFCHDIACKAALAFLDSSIVRE